MISQAQGKNIWQSRWNFRSSSVLRGEGVGPLLGLQDWVFLSSGFLGWSFQDTGPGILFSNFGVPGFRFFIFRTSELHVLRLEFRDQDPSNLPPSILETLGTHPYPGQQLYIRSSTAQSQALTSICLWLGRLIIDNIYLWIVTLPMDRNKPVADPELFIRGWPTDWPKGEGALQSFLSASLYIRNLFSPQKGGGGWATWIH